MRIPLALLLFLVAPPTLPAQTVDEIVGRYVAARGGLERIRSIASMRLSGTISPAPGESGPFRLELKRPQKMRVEMIVQGTTLTQATNGTTAWVVTPMLAAGAGVILPPEEAQGLKDQADVEGPLVDWKPKGHKVELLGRDARFAKEAFRLKVQLKSGDLRWLYIDTTSFLQLAEEGERPSPRGLVRIETRLSDHRSVKGLVIPFVLDISAGGEDRQRVAFDQVEVDVPIEDARFEPPPGAKSPPAPPR
jgi:hypothetical protein